MKPIPTAGMKTPAEIKQLAKYFMKSRLQVPRDESSMDWRKDISEVQSSPTPCCRLKTLELVKRLNLV